MSEMEYNKGKLIKVEESLEETAEREIKIVPEYYASKLEYFVEDAYSDLGYAIISSVLYKVEWEAKNGFLDEINNLTKDSDGNLLFETYHYNGGAHWTELVKNKMKDIL